MTSKKRLLITGGTGFIGSQLQKALSSSEYTIVILLRSEKQLAQYSQNNSNISYTTLDEISNKSLYFDIIINLAGENIAGARWSEKRKQKLYQSRVALTKALEQALDKKPKTLISMSAVGIYGTHPNRVFDEDMTGSKGFSHELCQAWEDSALKFTQYDTRVCITRLGVVLGHGGALAKMKPAFNFGLGGKIASGNQWFPWIHIDDVINLILFLIEADETTKGVFNAVAPQAITQKEFATAYAATLKRPCFFTTPGWLLSLMFGEMATLLTEGAQVIPVKTLASGYKFQFNNIDKALQDLT